MFSKPTPVALAPRPVTPLRSASILAILVALAISLWPAAPVAMAAMAAPARAQDRAAEIDAVIMALMARYDIPGASIAIVEDGQPTVTKGYGVRDTSTGAAVDAHTSFALGSVTKSLTALGIQILAAEGKVDLDKPVITYLPDLRLSDADAQKTITLRNLLSHTSGLSPADTGSQVITTTPISRDEYVKKIAEIPLAARPGQSFIYSNQNFVLAGLVIEKISGQKWEDFTRERIFAPLGMRDTGFDAADLIARADSALPHDLDVLRGMVPVEYTQNLTAIGPAGAANASAADMAAYMQFQLSGASADGKLTLPRKLLDAMHSPVINLSTPAGSAEAGAPPLTTGTSYALGWFTEQYRGLDLVQHGGNVVGFSSSVTLIPARRIGITILTNANYANPFLDAARLRVAEILTGLKSERDLAEAIDALSGFDMAAYKARLAAARKYQPEQADLDALTGTYTGSGGTLTITAKSSRLYVLQSLNGVTLELIPYQKDAFLGNTFPYRGSRFTFRASPSGTAIALGDPALGIQFGFRPAAGQVTKPVSDKDKRYTMQVPSGFIVQDLAGFQAAIQPLPQLIIVGGVYPIISADPLEDYEAESRKLDPTFKDKPIRSRQVTVNGVAWTEYEYALPSGQISLNYLTRKGKNNYYFGYAVAKTDLPKLQPVIDQIFSSFTISAD